jgi:hypothetical protein
MPRVGFEHTIPAFERAKICHALGRAATDKVNTVQKIKFPPQTQFPFNNSVYKPRAGRPGGAGVRVPAG